MNRSIPPESFFCLLRIIPLNTRQVVPTILNPMGGMQTVKMLLKTSDDPLLSYRTTPLPNNGYSPAEPLMNNKLRSNLPTLDNELRPEIPVRSRRMKHQGMRSKKRTLTVDIRPVTCLH